MTGRANPDDALLLERSLQHVADRGSTFAPAVYAGFFARHPDARDLFGNDEGDIRKEAMLLELLLWHLALAEGRRDPAGCRFWGADHAAMAVTMPMVRSLLDCLLQGVRDAAGAEWTPETETAWRRQVDAMLPHVAMGLDPARPTGP